MKKENVTVAESWFYQMHSPIVLISNVQTILPHIFLEYFFHPYLFLNFQIIKCTPQLSLSLMCKPSTRINRLLSSFPANSTKLLCIRGFFLKTVNNLKRGKQGFSRTVHPKDKPFTCLYSEHILKAPLINV